MMGILSVRLDSDLEEKLLFLMEKRKLVDKSSFVRHLLMKSITDEIHDFLCEEVRNNKISAWKAAEIAQISLRAMLRELSKREICLYDETALREDVEFALRE